MSEPSRFGRRLRRLRLAAGFTQEALAHRSGVVRQVITMTENGTQASMSLENAARIARGLNITLDYLFGALDEKEEEDEPDSRHGLGRHDARARQCAQTKG